MLPPALHFEVNGSFDLGQFFKRAICESIFSELGQDIQKRPFAGAIDVRHE